MNALMFRVESNQYHELYSEVLSITWDINENVVSLVFKDSNKNYISLIDLFSDKIKHNITLNVLESDKIIRYYDMQILPYKYIQSPLSLDETKSPKLTATYKILKSEVNFVEVSDE